METTLSSTRTITGADVAACGRLTGDVGSHHVAGLDGRVMAQGLLTLGVLPLFSQPGVDLGKMSVKFVAPVFVGDTITASLEILDTQERSAGLVDVSCAVSATKDGVEVMTGTGVAVVPAEIAEKLNK